MLTNMTVGILIFIVAVLMTMVGKGGGNFYVVILAFSGIPMHTAATTGQFILFSASIAALLIFQKNKSVSWTLALFIGTSTALSALFGGYFSHIFSGFQLKLIFAAMLLICGVAMLIPTSKLSKETTRQSRRIGVIQMKTGSESYPINLWLALPVTILAGLSSGMVGVSGGSFLVPLMVLACGVPMHIAVGTSSVLIAVTSLMGFVGHAAQGDFDPHFAIPLAFATIIGGLLGGKFALKSKPKQLKKLFAYTNGIAAFFMVLNACNALM